MTIKNPRRLGPLALVAAFAIGACTGNTGATASPSTAGGSAPAGVIGSISVSGSSTVERYSSRETTYATLRVTAGSISTVATFTLVARPMISRKRICMNVMSTSYQAKPWRAEFG